MTAHAAILTSARAEFLAVEKIIFDLTSNDIKNEMRNKIIFENIQARAKEIREIYCTISVSSFQKAVRKGAGKAFAEN